MTQGRDFLSLILALEPLDMQYQADTAIFKDET
jgi:hypothetical protein